MQEYQSACSAAVWHLGRGAVAMPTAKTQVQVIIFKLWFDLILGLLLFFVMTSDKVQTDAGDVVPNLFTSGSVEVKGHN